MTWAVPLTARKGPLRGVSLVDASADDVMRLILIAMIPLAIRRRTRGLRPSDAGSATSAELSICRMWAASEGR